MTFTLGWPAVALAALLLVWYARLPPAPRKEVRQLVREFARLVSAWRS